MTLDVPLEEALELSSALTTRIGQLDTVIGDEPEGGQLDEAKQLLAEKRTKLQKIHKRIETALNKL